MKSTFSVEANEVGRLAALRASAVLDSPPELAFDDLTEMASYICHVPISTITFIDAERQWFKSRIGVADAETPLDVSFCAQVVATNAPVLVHDASTDDRFRSYTNVVGTPHIRFYAGIPLHSREGYALGTLCVADHTPRSLDPMQEHALRALARQAAMHIEMRRVALELRESAGRIRILSGLVPMCAWCRRIRNDQNFWQQVEAYLADHSEAAITHSMCPECAESVSREIPSRG